jgi:hypothetical protein
MKAPTSPHLPPLSSLRGASPAFLQSSLFIIIFGKVQRLPAFYQSKKPKGGIEHEKQRHF